MYGTVARFKATPEFLDVLKVTEARHPEGIVRVIVYRMDADPDEYRMAVLFKDRESYLANARSVEQNTDYQLMKQHFLEEPVWHDGEIVYDTE